MSMYNTYSTYIQNTFLKLAPKVPYNYIPNNTHIHKVCKSVLPGPRCQLAIMCGFFPTSSKFCCCFSVKNGSWIVTLIHIAYLLILGFIEIAFEPDFFDVSFLTLGKFALLFSAFPRTSCFETLKILTSKMN